MKLKFPSPWMNPLITLDVLNEFGDIQSKFNLKRAVNFLKVVKETSVILSGLVTTVHCCGALLWCVVLVMSLDSHTSLCLGFIWYALFVLYILP